MTKPPLAFEDAFELLGPALPGGAIVLVGGQALIHWLTYYRDRVEARTPAAQKPPAVPVERAASAPEGDRPANLARPAPRGRRARSFGRALARSSITNKTGSGEANALDVYTVGSGEVWHGSGTSWQESTFESSSQIYVSGNSTTEVFLIRRDGSFYQSSGDNAWTLAPEQPALDATYNSFRGLRSFGGGIYAFGRDLQRREPDGSWSTVLKGTTLPGSVSEAWGSSADDFYVCVDSGNAGVYHRRGTTFVLEREGGHCSSLSGTGPGDVYVAGLADLSHSQGDGQWDPIALPLAQGEVPYAVFAQAPNAVFVGTNESTMFFFDGTEWTNIGRQAGGSYAAIWAPSPDEVYVCGGSGAWYGKRRVP